VIVAALDGIRGQNALNPGFRKVFETGSTATVDVAADGVPISFLFAVMEDRMVVLEDQVLIFVIAVTLGSRAPHAAGGLLAQRAGGSRRCVLRNDRAVNGREEQNTRRVKLGMRECGFIER
jgi:hypothetical protein